MNRVSIVNTQTPPELVASGEGTVQAAGSWTADALTGGRPAALARGLSGGSPVRIDLSRISQIDMFGAATLVDLAEELEGRGVSTEFFGGSERAETLVKRLSEADVEDGRKRPPLISVTIRALGKMVVEAGEDAADISIVLGHTIVSIFALITLRGPVRVPAIVNQFQDIVLRAIPIVALISFVVGIILTQQSIAQLRNFGATIFVVDLGGILMLREVGILLAAIMVAGRSGSAITAELGAMRMREEVDALEVIGLDTYRTVVMPRVIALVLGMPALGIVSAIAGIVGGALVARISGGISLETFVNRLGDVVDLHIIMVGVVKAPFVALAIAVIGVSEGLRVAGSTQSLGRHTTASVVKSIFIVIVLDGVFALFFEAIRF